MDQIKLAIVGCGDVANDIALVSKLVRQVRLFAACDIDHQRAQAYATRNRIKLITTDYAEILARAEIDAVYLATPHDLHYDMILAATRAGKHVFTEKPITRTYAEAKKLVAQIDGAKVGVNYQYRYDAGCYPMARAVQAGTLGKIHTIRINIPWHRGQSYFEGATWHKTIARAGGGTLITQASHLLDVALWALGEKPVSATGYTKSSGFDVEVDTITHAIVETENETLISITSSMVASSEQPVTIEIYGEHGTALYKDKPLPAVRFKDVRIRKQRPPEWGVHALQRSLAGFAHWLLQGKPFLTPANEALTVLAAVEGIYRSAQSGKRETIIF